MEQNLELTKNNIADYLSVSENILEPFKLNLKRVMLMLDEYANCFPTGEEYASLEDEEIKEIYFTAICLQWDYMIKNAEMYNPAEALIGQKVGRHSYEGISSEALRSFVRYEPSATSLLERKGLTCNGIDIVTRSNCWFDC